MSLLLMPPTLITGFFGMNMKLPLTGSGWDAVIVLALMFCSLGIILMIFRKRKML